MTIPGILLAPEMSGQRDEELARRLQRRDPDFAKRSANRQRAIAPAHYEGLSQVETAERTGEPFGQEVTA